MKVQTSPPSNRTNNFVIRFAVLVLEFLIASASVASGGWEDSAKDRGSESTMLEQTGERVGTDAPPPWSGVPVVAGDHMILPLHVADMRQITFGPEWAHIDYWANEGGDVEYHSYRRIAGA